MGRLYAIETDIADTLKVIEESKTDRSENVGWSTDYVLEVMDNEKWLIGEIAKLREGLKEAKKRLEDLAGDYDYPKRQTIEGNWTVYNIVTKALEETK